MMHALKLTQPYFDDVAKGDKSFEVRKLDRPYEVGDYLALNEYVDEKYTGRFMVAKIKYILTASEIPATSMGYGVLGIVPCNLYCSDGIYRLSLKEEKLVSSYEVYNRESDES